MQNIDIEKSDCTKTTGTQHDAFVFILLYLLERVFNICEKKTKESVSEE